VDPGRKKSDFFWKNFDFFRLFHPKISIFQGKFSKNFDFFRQFYTKISILQVKISELPFVSFYPDKIDHLQQLLSKLLYFPSKVTTF